MVQTLEAIQLTDNETLELETLEKVIGRGIKSLWEAGRALAAIRDKHLYRSTHTTFQGYCAQRWGFSDENARLLMRGSEFVANLQQTPTIVGVLPANEQQTRPLINLSPDQQRAAWQESVDTAPNGKVTGSHVKAVAQKYKTKTLSEVKNTTVERSTSDSNGQSSASQSKPTQATGWPAAQVNDFATGTICRILDSNRKDFGKKVEILEMATYYLAVVRCLDSNEKICLRTEQLKPLQRSPNYYLHQCLCGIGIPHNLALTLLHQIADQTKLPRDLLHELSKFG